MEAILKLDGAFLLWIQDHLRNPVLTPMMKGITALGNSGIFWIALTVLLLLFRKTRRAGAASAVALVLSFVIVNLIIKNAVGRIRPYEVIEGLQCLVGKRADPSFPSGHASASFASSVAICRCFPKRKMGIGLVVLAGVIAFSRLYVGVHYPTDVLAGVFFGVLSAWIAVSLLKKLQARKKEI